MTSPFYIKDLFCALSIKVKDNHLYDLYILCEDMLVNNVSDTGKYGKLLGIISSDKLSDEDLKKINALNILLLKNIIDGLDDASIVSNENIIVDLLDSNVRYVQLLLSSRASNIIASTICNKLQINGNEKLKNELFDFLLVNSSNIGDFEANADSRERVDHSVIEEEKFAQCAASILSACDYYAKQEKYVVNDVTKVRLFILASEDFISTYGGRGRCFNTSEEYYNDMADYISAICTLDNSTGLLLNQSQKLSKLVKKASVYTITHDRFYNGDIINSIHSQLQEHFFSTLKSNFPDFHLLNDRERTSVMKSSDILCNEIMNLLLHDIECSNSYTAFSIDEHKKQAFDILNSFYKICNLNEDFTLDYTKYMNLFNAAFKCVMEVQNDERFSRVFQCKIVSKKIENTISLRNIEGESSEHVQRTAGLDDYKNESADDFLREACQSELAMILASLSYRASENYQIKTEILNAYHNGFVDHIDEMDNDEPSIVLNNTVLNSLQSYFPNVRETINHLDCDKHNRLSNMMSAEPILSLNNKSDVAFRPANYANTNLQMRKLYKDLMLDFIDFHKLENKGKILSNSGRLIVDSVSSKIKRGQIRIEDSGKLLRNLVSFFVPKSNKEEFLTVIENFITTRKELAYINNLNLYYSQHNYDYVPISDIEHSNKIEGSLEKIASYVEDSGENIDLQLISDNTASIADVFLVINNITNNMVAGLVTDSKVRKGFYLSADIVDLYLTLESFSSLRNELLERKIFTDGNVSLQMDTTDAQNISHIVKLVCFDHLQIMEESVSKCVYDSYLEVKKKNVDIDNNKTKTLLTNILETQKFSTQERAIIACYNKFTEKLDGLNIYNSEFDKELKTLLKDINKREELGITIKNHCKTLSEKYDFVLCMVYFSLLTSAIIGNFLGQRAFEDAGSLADTLSQVNNGDLNILDMLNNIPEDVIYEKTSEIVQNINVSNIRDQLRSNLFNLNMSSEIANFYSNNSYPGLPINPISLVSSCVAIVSYFWSLGIQIPNYYTNFMAYNEQAVFKNLVTGNNSPEVNEKIVHLALGKEYGDIADFTLQDYSKAAIKSTSQILSSHLYIPTPSSIKEAQIMALGFSAWFSGASLSRLMGNFYAEFGDAMPNNANLLFPLYMVYDLYAVIASIGGEKASGLMSDFMYLQADSIKELFQKLGNRNAALTVHQEKMLINVLGSENYEKIKEGIIVDEGLKSGLSDLAMTRKYRIAAQSAMAVTNAAEVLTFSYTGCDAGRLFELINVDTPAQVARDTAREIFAVQQTPIGSCPIEGAEGSVHAPDSFTQSNCQFFIFDNERNKPKYDIGKMPFTIWRSIFTNFFGKVMPTAAATSINLCMRKEIGIEHSDSSPVKHMAKGMLFKDLVAGTVSQVFGMSTDPLNRKIASGVDSLGTILGDLMVKKAMSTVEIDYGDLKNYTRQSAAKLHSRSTNYNPYVSSAAIISTGDHVLFDTRSNALIGNIMSKISDKCLQDTANIADQKSFEDLIYTYRAKVENMSGRFMDMKSDEYDSEKFIVDELQNDIKSFHSSDLKFEKDFLCRKLSDKTYSSAVQVIKILSYEMQDFQNKHTENCIKLLSDAMLEKEQSMNSSMSLGY